MSCKTRLAGSRAAKGAGFRTLGPPQADDLSEIALSFVELTYSDGICGAESPEPLGSISRQLQSKVLLEEDDCQYSQEILER